MTATKFEVTHEQVLHEAARVAAKVGPGHRIYGIPRGGITPAYLVKMMTTGSRLVENPGEATLFVDDIYDSGATAERYRLINGSADFHVLFHKGERPWKGRWLVMPWERDDKGVDDSGDDIVLRLLEFIGENPNREGLQETPRRVLKGWQEWASGYRTDLKSLFKVFEDGGYKTNEMVIVHNVPIFSKCEHHLADITGLAHVGYIPDGKILGLSKLARVADAFARRLQVQERMTHQIADCLVEHLAPKGVGVLVRATHGCMTTRGVKIHGGQTSTSAMRGALLDQPAARAEFLQLCDMAERRYV